MGYLLLLGPSLKNKNFEQREEIREEIRLKLEALGIVLQEYVWIWDKKDQLRLLIGEYKDTKDCFYLQKYLQKNGLKTEFSNKLPL